MQTINQNRIKETPAFTGRLETKIQNEITISLNG